MKSFKAKAQANLTFDKGTQGPVHRLRTRHRVLILDNDFIFSRRLSDYLVGHGFEARVTKTVAEAKEFIEFWGPDSVFLDLHLPDTTALSILKFVNTRHLSKAPKMIVMSKQSQPGLVEQVRKAGASHFLVKPFSLEEAFRAVEIARAGEQPPQVRREEQLAPVLKEPPPSITELHLINLFLKQATQTEKPDDRLYKLMRMINLKVDGLRTSLIQCVNDHTALVLASNDDETVRGLTINMSHYPELQAVRTTGSSIVIPDVQTSELMVKTKIGNTPFTTMVLFPVYRDNKFYGVLSVRLKKKDALEIFYVEKFGQVCSQIISLSMPRAV